MMRTYAELVRNERIQKLPANTKMMLLRMAAVCGWDKADFVLQEAFKNSGKKTPTAEDVGRIADKTIDTYIVEETRLHRQALSCVLGWVADEKAQIAKINAEMIRNERMGELLPTIVARLNDFGNIYGPVALDQILQATQNVVNPTLEDFSRAAQQFFKEKSNQMLKQHKQTGSCEIECQPSQVSHYKFG